MHEVKIHVEPLEAFVARTGEMARRLDRGDYKSQPAHVSFETMEELLRVLTPGRWALLRQLRSAGPSSVRATARALGRDYRGVHDDVTALIAAGLVERGSDARILVPWSRISAELVLDAAA